jgi:phosphatidylglycerophosphate synthase
MRTRVWTAATIVTLARLAFLPILWVWAVDGKVPWVGVGVMASFVGDILDGQLARRMNQVTALGSRLDSLADSLLLASSVWWLLWFQPELLSPPYVFGLAFGLGTWVLLIAVGLLRFRRFLNLHLYSGKASGVVGALFVMDALVFGFHPPFFFIAAFVLSLGNLEGLALMLTRSRIDEHIGSILARAVAPKGRAIAKSAL